MKKEHLEWLEINQACSQSISWIKRDNIQSLEEAWYTCGRGDWMLWMAKKLGIDRHKLVLSASLCAHTAVQYMQDPRSRNAVRIAFLWSRGKATDEQLMAARNDACDAEDVIDCGDYYSARAAASAAAASWASCVTDETAACDTAAAAADAAASWALSDDARKANQMRTASIVMELLTEEVMYILSNL